MLSYVLDAALSVFSNHQPTVSMRDFTLNNEMSQPKTQPYYEEIRPELPAIIAPCITVLYCTNIVLYRTVPYRTVQFGLRANAD